MAVFSPFESIILILYLSGKTLAGLAPYLAAGVVLGEVLKLTSWTKLARRTFSGAPILSVVLAAVLGMVSPLCTYGTVPVVLQLFRAGVSAAPLVTFLSVSSMMNPQLFILTWGGLGARIALERIAMILVFGLSLGFLLLRVPSGLIVNPGAGGSAEDEAACAAGIEGRGKKAISISGFLRNIVDTLRFVGLYVVLGAAFGAALDVLAPKAALIPLFRENRLVSTGLAAALGVPLYACGGGAIPVVRQFMNDGLGTGAALAFLFVGPATRISPLLALGTILRTRTLVLYVMLVLAFAFVAGLVIR